jgi:DNA-directed RNA polymerase I, II, and III subunit RPABC1
MEKTYEYYVVYKNILEMLEYRGCKVSELEKTIDFETFSALYGDIFNYGTTGSSDKIRFIVEKKNDPSEKTLIIFPKEDKVKIEHIQQNLANMDQFGVKHCIIIYSQTITSFAQNTFNDILKKPELGKNLLSGRFELFSISEILNKPTEHELVAKSKKLTEEEKAKFLKDHPFIKLSELPKMEASDVIASYYGLKKGDVIEVESWMTTGIQKLWQLVV